VRSPLQVAERFHTEKGRQVPKRAETAAEKPAAKRTITRRKKVAAAPVELTWDTVATRAYYLSLETGSDPLENWLRAERELLAA
jgi:hypothetical protein